MKKEKEKNKSTELTLHQIIQRKTKKTVTFEELEEEEQTQVLSFIKAKKISIRIFEKRGYDVLTKKFFAFEYVLEEESGIAKKEKYEFETFDDLFNLVDGHIYEFSCFFGYVFSIEEIKKYHIELSKINFDSFILEDITQNTFEGLIGEEKNENQKNIDRGIELAEWVKKIKFFESYTSMVKKMISFTKKYDIRFADCVFFSLLIQKFGESIKDYIINFQRLNGPQKGVEVDDILFYYGVQAAQDVLINYEGGDWAKNTKKKHIKKIKDKISFFKAENTTVEKKGFFDEKTQLYIVSYFFYNDDIDCGKYPFMSVSKYLFDFDNFAKELGGDLSNVNLRKTSITSSEAFKYKTNEATLLPLPKQYAKYKVDKYFRNERFVVCQEWYDEYDNLILQNLKKFNWFCDFTHYLKNDLSNADLLLCEGLENISFPHNLKLNGVKIRSDIAKLLNLSLTNIVKDKYELVEYNETKNSELATINVYLNRRNEEYDSTSKISYVTDIHLLHRFSDWKCVTENDCEYVIRKIISKIEEDENIIKLIGGDISSDFDFYKLFINSFRARNSKEKIFFTLGNHEVWPFKGKSIESIVEIYSSLLSNKGMFLVHNNIFYYDDTQIKEITSSELETISEDKLRDKLRCARLIIFGGIGFSGYNNEFNANQGIYRGVITREQEIIESQKFERLYDKISRILWDKNVIIFTHMPTKDWSKSKVVKGFVYVNGHNHRNYFYDDGVTRIYADNQIGYKQKNIEMKKLSINFDYDLFSDYTDGIYEISRKEYISFYRGIREGITFNRKFDHLYMLKREESYMFLMTTLKGKLEILDGGAIRSAGNHTLEYFYKNLLNYSRSIKMYLSNFNEVQKQVSKVVRSIGGSGHIHGCIVDIDFYNHLYLNPFDGSITPYFAYSIIEKYVYKNLLSLLKNQCPTLFLDYERKYLGNKTTEVLMPFEDNNTITDEAICVTSTEMYSVSRIIKKLQYTTEYSIVRSWNDSLVSESSKENGRLIVSNVVNYEKTKLIEKDKNF